jgi:poly(ADP-ribose) glycohydrolase ARH3
MDLKERFTGCLTGLALGDALGAPFEGNPHSNASPLKSLLSGPPPLPGYTDDTEMAIGVAESLAERDGLDQEDMAQRFSRNFNPLRGYGPGTIHVLGLIKKGTPWHRANRTVFPDGSFGNGAAMRAAPLGLFYFKNPLKLREAAYGASAITHDHPLAKEGAYLIAYSAALAVNGASRSELLDSLMEITVMEEYRRKLRDIRPLLEGDPPLEEVIGLLGNTVEALESVPAALYAFLRHGEDFVDTVGFCVSLGGDTDTISAMAGAITGAHLGYEGLPGELTSRIENRELLISLAEGLYKKAS